MSKLEKFRDRKFCLLLYPDCPEHSLAFEVIKQGYDYAAILHDKDTDDDGVVKKAHWHIVLRCSSNAIWSTALADDLGITANYIERCRNLDRALEYLIHFNESDKYQYAVTDVFGPLVHRLQKLVNSVNKDEGEKVIDLISYIESMEGYLSCTDFSKWCASNGYWDVYRRAGGIFNNILSEHNDSIRRKLQNSKTSNIS